MIISISRMLTIGILPSKLKKMYYRMQGAKIGKSVSLGIFSTIQAGEIEIGENSRIGPFVQINAKKFKMGAHSEVRMMTSIDAAVVEIGDETIIMEQTIIGGMEARDSSFKIGDRCKVFPLCFINPTRPISIGDDVGIGGANYLFTHGTWSNYLEGGPIAFGPITIEDRVWLPWRVFVLPNVTIGHDSVVGAGSVITKSIPPKSLAVGSPAVVKRTGTEFMEELTVDDKLERLLWVLDNIDDFFKMKKLEAKDMTGEVIPEGILWSRKIVQQNGKEIGIVSVSNKPLDQSVLVADRNHIYLSFCEMSVEMKATIENRNGGWFDLNLYEWGGRRTALVEHLRKYLSRFGIRFKSMDLA